MLDEKGYRYLYHVLKKENLESVLSHKMLYSEFDRYRLRIQVDGAYSTTVFNFDKPWVVCSGQFPGLYMSLSNELPKLEKDEICLLFPTEILHLQKNWHFNLFDRNGTFGYDTYTHETMHLLPPFQEVKDFYIDRIKRYSNEVVFHDSIDMRGCQFVYDGKDLYSLHSLASSFPSSLEYELVVNNRPGAFLYYSDKWYTGINVPYYSRPDETITSLDFYREYVKEYIKNKNIEIIEKINMATSKREIENLIEKEDLFTFLFMNRDYK